MGTECGRNTLHPNLWVNSLMSEYKPIRYWDKSRTTWISSRTKAQEEEFFKSVDTLHTEAQYPNWVITDTRFPNELKAVKDRGGISIRVIRPKPLCTCVTSNANCNISCDKAYIKEHESETSLDSAVFDYIVDNNSSILNLIKTVRIILQKENII